jgi:hypothetical protein
MQEVLSQGDELKTVELAQLAQVDLAMRLEVDWYSERAWLQDGRPADLLSGLYWLGRARCASWHACMDPSCSHGITRQRGAF